MAFIEKYSYEVVLYVATEMCVDVTTHVTIGELKEAIINSEYYEEEFVESFLESTMEDMEEEAEKQRCEKERQEVLMRMEKEHKERQMKEVQKKHEEIRLFYLGVEKYENLYGPVSKDRNLHQRLSESSSNIEVHSEKIRNVDGRQSSQPRSQILKCWSCNQNTHMRRDCPNKIKASHNVKENSSVKVEAGKNRGIPRKSGSMTLVDGSACKDASLKINLEGLGGNSENLDKKMADADDILPEWLFVNGGDDGAQQRLKVVQPVQDEQSTSPDDDTPPRLIGDNVYGPVHGEQHPAVWPLDEKVGKVQEKDSFLNGVDNLVYGEQRHAVWPLDRRGSNNPEEDDFFKYVDTTVHGEQHPAVDPQKEEDNCFEKVGGLIHQKQQPAVWFLDGGRASLREGNSFLEVERSKEDTQVHAEQQPTVGLQKDKDVCFKDRDSIIHIEQLTAVSSHSEEEEGFKDINIMIYSEQKPAVWLLEEEARHSEQLYSNMTYSSVSISKESFWKVLFEDIATDISSRILSESVFTAGMTKGSFYLKILNWPKWIKVGIG